MMTPEALQEAIQRLPRVPLAHRPTPLDDCPVLSQALGGPRILAKRDDLTGPAFGGNKVRHLEFRMGLLQHGGYDVYIGQYPPTSNEARIAAAACARAGIRFILLVKKGDRIGVPQGNVLLYHLLGAEMVFLDTDDPEAVKTEVQALEERLRRAGHRPFTFQFSPWTHLSGVIGHLDAALEIDRQLQERAIEEAHFYIVAGRSHTGLQLAAKLLGRPWRVTGVAVQRYAHFPDVIPEWSRGVAEALGLPATLGPEELDIDYRYIDTYDLVLDSAVEAIKLAARTENLILDPMYTGKAMAVLMDHVRTGRVTPDETVVFMHTGGTPLVFQYAQELSADLVRVREVSELPA